MKKRLSLLISLTAISAVCAGVLAYIDAVTRGHIEKARAENALKAARDVMPPGVVDVEACSWADDAKHDATAFVGRGGDGMVAGYAQVGRDGGGYGGEIALMVGFEADRRTLVCYRKLEASETPGLGMKLVSPEFADQFRGKDGTALKVVKDGGDIEAITAATITSRAVCRAIADAAARVSEISIPEGV